MTNDPFVGAERLRIDTPARGGSVLNFYVPGDTLRPPRIARGRGIFLWDTDGRRYIDATSGAVVVNIGHGNERVLAAMAAQSRKVTFAYPRYFESDDSIALSNLTCELAGAGFDRAFFVSGGSEANEAAMKLARQYAVAIGQSGRYKVVSRMPSYHGSTLGALSVSGDAATEALFGSMTRMMPNVPAPLSYRIPAGHDLNSHALACASALESLIEAEGPETVLAFIMEPVGGLSTGADIAPDAYYRRIRDICDRFGVLLIFDEIMSGAGRTGTFLAAHRWPEARPDIVTLAKGLAAGYTPLGAVLAPTRIVEPVARAGGFAHGHTYFTNPLSCAIAHAVLKEVVTQSLPERAETMGHHLTQRLREVARRSRIVGDVRGTGLLCAIEIVADKETKRSFPPSINAPARLSDHGFRHGIALYNRRANQGVYGDFQMIAPPLTIRADEIDELTFALEHALSDLESEMRTNGLL